MARRRRTGNQGNHGVGRLLAKGLAFGVAGLGGLVGVAAAGLALTLSLSKPALEGNLALAGLSAPVSIARDAQGVPELTGATRADLARALGFLHGQERFFQMDLIRRASAGELSGLLGPIGAVLEIDTKRRLHRFRHRAGIVLANTSAEQRVLLDAYTAGVNAGLDTLGATPFEYAILFASPQPWRAEDSILAAYSMYLDLQDEDATDDRNRAGAIATLGAELAAFLYPRGTPLDSPIDGSTLPEVPMPAGLPSRGEPVRSGLVDGEPGPVLGSNAWAVAGGLTASGAALVANDMHLGISVPGTWYRARLRLTGDDPLDVTGVTLPGTPMVVAGSNGKVAWGYTNSYIDTADAVILDPVAGQPDQYQTPDGPKPLVRTSEQICPAWTGCQPLVVEESIWGPVVETRADGTRVAVRWTAHDADAINLSGMIGMERATSVPDAIALAHAARQPQQNFVVGDAAGNVAWTIIGAVPARFGQDGSLPTSWADGTRGWNGNLAPADIPLIVNPEAGRIWTANARIVGGDAYAKLGDGGYDIGARQGQIRDALFAKAQFQPTDMLTIQLEDRNRTLDFWQAQMVAALEARASDPSLFALLAPVRDWGGRAVPESVGYRLVRTFRIVASQRLYGAYLGVTGPLPRTRSASQMEAPLRRLLTERPGGLVPPGHADWDGFMQAVLADVAKQVADAGGVANFTWGARNKAGVTHPLARILPPVAWLTDPPDQGMPGDSMVPRAQGVGFGASERFAVSPGNEDQGFFHMPGSQSGHPWTPYYLAGHQDWVQGNPTPFRPGAAVWTLTLRPGG